MEDAAPNTGKEAPRLTTRPDRRQPNRCGSLLSGALLVSVPGCPQRLANGFPTALRWCAPPRRHPEEEISNH